MESSKELMEQIAALELRVIEVRESEIADALAKVLALVTEYGLTAEDIFSKKRGRKTIGKKAKTKVAAKYKDANGNSWTGRGRAPKWIEGKDKSKFLIA